MTKAFVDSLIQNMKRAGLVAKASPWSFEGFGDKQKSVRYMGLVLSGDWLEVFSENDNVLLKFVIDRTSGFIEYYLANKPPFIKISSTRFKDSDKWELLLGELRRQLKKDKHDYLHHTDSIDNLYIKIKSQLK